MSTELFRVPVEVLADVVVFDVVSRGYDRRQVDAHVAALEQELAELRWAQDDLAAQQEALAAQREAQERWTPSFDALGARVVEVLRLAEQEAAALREEAAGEVGRLRHEATAALLAERADLERGLGEARQAAARELRSLESAGESRRDVLEAEIARRRRDAELEVAGALSTATARAQDLLAAAARDAEAVRDAARAEVAHLQHRRDEFSRELADLSARLVAVVHRLGATDEAPPLDVHTG